MLRRGRRVRTRWAAGLGGLDDDRREGLASRPTRSRSAVTSAWVIRASLRQAANHR